LDIYNAVDPKSLDDLIGIHSHPAEQCPFGKNITSLLAEPYAEISDTMRQKMASITLERLCNRLGEIEPTLK
jgi:DNA-binding IscR family transcriptional regulator